MTIQSSNDIGGSHKVIDKAAYFRKIGYYPHTKQHLYHQAPQRFKIAVCGRRFGKSTMAGKDVQPKLLLPKQRMWIVGPTYDLAEKEFRVVWDDMIIGLGLGRDKRVKRAYSKRSGDMYIEFPWQTRIECRSAEHPEYLIGDGLDHVIMSEAAKHKKDTFERYIRAALADRRGSADFPTTPEGYNWLYDMWAMGQNPEYADYVSWQFPSWDNPALYPEGRNDPEILLIERTTILPWFLQEIAAEFSAFVGKIYDAFKETTHVRKHVFNPEWPNYITFDWGFTNPLAAIEFQVSPWDTIHVWREHYRAYLTLPEHIEIIKNREQPPGYHLDLGFGDSADPGAAVYVSEKLVPCFALPEAKSGTKGGKLESGWREGVDLVNGFLRLIQTGEADEYGTPLEEPRLFVDHSCVHTIREFNNYRAPSSTGRTLRNTREDAQRYDDHSLDAIRYALMHIFRLGCTHRLSDVYSAGDLRVAASTFSSAMAQELGESPLVSVAGSSGYFSMSELEHM
jgi:hypothetical protein